MGSCTTPVYLGDPHNCCICSWSASGTHHHLTAYSNFAACWKRQKKRFIELATGESRRLVPKSCARSRDVLKTPPTWCWAAQEMTCYRGSQQTVLTVLTRRRASLLPCNMVLFAELQVTDPSTTSSTIALYPCFQADSLQHIRGAQNTKNRSHICRGRKTEFFPSSFTWAVSNLQFQDASWWKQQSTHSSLSAKHLW